MDTPQLKLLADRVRGLLKTASCIVGHSQALDLVAALPGLRNWPEVVAFPDRVATCQLNATSVGRLAFRLKKKCELELTPKDLLAALAPETLGTSQGAPQVWPGGPPPGVYVTTSAQAIDALLARYEDATDGGLVYAERAGNSWEGSIDLGDYGLWSPGIERLPSGTLLVVGPIELDQQSWEDAAKRLEMACLHALDSEHRVAVLVETPTPQTLCEDLMVLVRSASEDPSDVDTALVGLVTEEGELERRLPFATAYPQPVPIHVEVDLRALPESTREPLGRELAAHTAGIVLVAASRIVEHTGYDQLAACLALTEHAGPAARIMARHRSTPAKDWLVPEAIKALPFLPSIECAYQQGYRRMLFDSHYSKADLLLDYDDVLFIGGTYGHDVANVALSLVARSGRKEVGVLKRIIAVLGLLQLPGKNGEVVASDLFIRGDATGPIGTEWNDFETFLKAKRVVSWEEELTDLLDAGATTTARVKKAEPGNHEVMKFLTRRRTSKAGS